MALVHVPVMRRSVLIALAVLLASGVASAQPGLTAPGLTPPTVQLSPAPEGVRKDPSIAVLLSLGITSASYVALFASDNENLQLVGAIGTYIGPSTGQWYAGQFGGLGMGLRAAGFLSALYGFSQILESECDYEYEYDCSDSDAAGTRGGIMLIGGASLWFGSTIYDIVLAKRAADSWNTRHQVGVAPLVANDAAGNRAAGVVMTGRF